MVITAHHQCDDFDLIESTCIGQYSEIPTTPTNDPIDEEIREEHAFPGHEQMVSSFRLHLIVVTFIKTKMASNKRVEVCIYDSTYKYVAFQCTLEDLISIVNAWSSVFILTNEYLIKLRDKDLQEKSNEFFPNNLYEKAIQLANKCMKRICQTLIENQPEDITELIKVLCTNFDSEHGTEQKANAEEFIHLFVGKYYNTVLEMYVREAFNLKSKKRFEQYENISNQILRILRTETCKYYATRALAFDKMYGIESAVIYLYEVLHLYHEIISVYRDKNDSKLIIETCIKFNSRNRTLWLPAFKYFINRHSQMNDIYDEKGNDNNIGCIHTCVQEIYDLNLIPFTHLTNEIEKEIINVNNTNNMRLGRGYNDQPFLTYASSTVYIDFHLLNISCNISTNHCTNQYTNTITNDISIDANILDLLRYATAKSNPTLHVNQTLIDPTQTATLMNANFELLSYHLKSTYYNCGNNKNNNKLLVDWAQTLTDTIGKCGMNKKTNELYYGIHNEILFLMNIRINEINYHLYDTLFYYPQNRNVLFVFCIFMASSSTLENYSTKKRCINEKI